MLISITTADLEAMRIADLEIEAEIKAEESAKKRKSKPYNAEYYQKNKERINARRKAKREQKKAELTPENAQYFCANCGKPILILSKSHVKERNYCSNSCSGKAQWERRKSDG